MRLRTHIDVPYLQLWGVVSVDFEKSWHSDKRSVCSHCFGENNPREKPANERIIKPVLKCAHGEEEADCETFPMASDVKFEWVCRYWRHDQDSWLVLKSLKRFTEDDFHSLRKPTYDFSNGHDDFPKAKPASCCQLKFSLSDIFLYNSICSSLDTRAKRGIIPCHVGLAAVEKGRISNWLPRASMLPRIFRNRGEYTKTLPNEHLSKL